MTNTVNSLLNYFCDSKNLQPSADNDIRCTVYFGGLYESTPYLKALSPKTLFANVSVLSNMIGLVQEEAKKMTDEVVIWGARYYSDESKTNRPEMVLYAYPIGMTDKEFEEIKKQESNVTFLVYRNDPLADMMEFRGILYNPNEDPDNQDELMEEIYCMTNTEIAQAIDDTYPGDDCLMICLARPVLEQGDDHTLEIMFQSEKQRKALAMAAEMYGFDYYKAEKYI